MPSHTHPMTHTDAHTYDTDKRRWRRPLPPGHDVFTVVQNIIKTPVKLQWNLQQPAIVAVVSEKGGVGKTSLATGLAAVMGAQGRQVLVVDLDPRATATAELGVTDPAYTVNDLLYVDPHDDEPADIIGAAGDDGVIVAAGPDWPDTVRVLAAERKLGHREADMTSGMEQRLRLALQGVAEQFDMIVMDIPPRPGGKLAAAALWTANTVVMPATMDADGYIGVKDALITIRRARLTAGLPPLPVTGVLRHIVDRNRTTLAREYDEFLYGLAANDGFEAPDDDEQALRAFRFPEPEFLNLLMMDTAVPKYVVRQEARDECVPITFSTSPEARAIQRAYLMVCNAISSTLEEVNGRG